MAFAAGSVAGPWRLSSRLGAGGMGEVWRAEGAGGAAAVKLLRVANAQPLELRRFEREAAALLELRHPNVIRAFGFGQAEDGTPYLAMELLEGESLDWWLRARATLPPADVLRLGRQAAAGLGAAHAAGIVHRDVKPGNLFVCRDGTLKVLDFGLAIVQPIDGDGAEAGLRLTGTGNLVGTPSYMAPEQASGARAEDARTDVFALGAVLHHALSGRPPFHARGVLAELARIATQPPDPLPAHVPRALAAAVLRALEKEPERRFPSMVELGRALAHAEDEENGAPEGPALARTETSGEVFAEEVRLVSAILAEGVRDDASLQAFLDEVRRQGGRGAALRGGRAVGVLGGAEWSGDEAERAVRAARRARAHAARFGIGTGRAVLRPGGADLVIGDALAAAEAALGSTGAAVAACPETARRIRGAFEVEGASVLDEARPARDPAAERDSAGGEAPFVGRDVELARLVALVARAIEESRAAAAVVLGPPGIGKTRVGRELRRSLQGRPDAVRWLAAQGEAARAVASHAVARDLVRRWARIPEGTEPAQARARLRAAVEEALPAGDPGGACDFLGELLGLPFPESQHLRTARADPQIMADRIRLALADVLEGMARRGPLVIAVDDAQWADAASLALLDFVLLRLADCPAALVATARPELAADRPDAFPGAERIALGELPRRAVAAIVERILGRPEPAVAERAAGNPYFAEELALAVRDGAGADALPLTVEGAVRARLDRLEPRSKDALKRAAVVGQRFWVEALEWLGEPEAPRVLAALRRRDLVVPRPESGLAGCREWTFRHAIVHAVCRSLLTPEQSQGMHARAAAWLEERPDAAPEELAAHHEAAGAAGAARRAWLRAAREADRRGDAENTLAWSARALEGGGLAPIAEHALRLRRLDAYYWSTSEGEGAELEAIAELETRGGPEIPPAARSEARRRRATFLRRRGRIEEAIAAATEAVTEASDSGEPAVEARARATQAIALTLAGRLGEAAATAEGAVALGERSGDPIALAHAAVARAAAAGAAGRGAGATAWYGRAQCLFAAAGDLRESAAAALNHATTLHNHGDFETAYAALGRALEDTRRLNLRVLEGWALCNRGFVAACLGDAAGAETALRAAAERGRAVSSPRLVVASHAYLAEALRRRGDPEAALHESDLALRAASERGGPVVELLARAARTLALVALRRHDEALAESDRAVALRAAAGGMEEMEVDLFLARHDALAALERPEEARAALEAARGAFEGRLAAIDDPRLRRCFVENLPAHARLVGLLGLG